MNTPDARNVRAVGLLYGASCHSINRRAILGGAAAIAALPATRSAPATLVDRALAAAGGRDLLSRIRVVWWAATVRTLLGTTPVDLLVETRMEPFVRVRQDSWLASEGRSTARIVMVEGERAFVVHDGAQTALPADMARMQHDQFGAFAYMLLGSVAWTDVGQHQIAGRESGFPEMRLTIGPDGRILAGAYPAAAASPARARSGDKAAAAFPHFRFAGSVAAQGVRFPRRIETIDLGRVSSTMTLSDFTVELATA